MFSHHGGASIGPAVEVGGSKQQVEVTLDNVQEVYNNRSSKAAILTLQQLIVAGKAPPLAYWFVVGGREKFSEKLIATWQNVGIVAALIGAVAISVLLGSPGAADAFLNSNEKFLSTNQSLLIGRCYYICWAVATISELATVVLVTIACNHYYLMLSDEDIVWFVIRWEFLITDFPQIFLVAGIIACDIGVMLGAYLICDITTAYIVSAVCGAIGLMVIVIWLYMLLFNKIREAKALADVRALIEEAMKKNT